MLRDEQDTELVYARGMRIARGDNGLAESLLDMPGPVAVAGPDDSIPEHGYPLPAGGFYMDAFDIRSVDGRSFGAAGSSAAWFRLLAPVFAGEPITPLDRVLAMADFGNGISNIIEMGRHLYINPDLTVNVHRLPCGEWLLSMMPSPTCELTATAPPPQLSPMPTACSGSPTSRCSWCPRDEPLQSQE